jgi:hypothetical protein
MATFASVSAVLDALFVMVQDIVNSCYICWSLDRDQQKVTRPEIAAIYEQVGRTQMHLCVGGCTSQAAIGSSWVTANG